jgi:predicted nucleotidyltransferase component of viral defense system
MKDSPYYKQAELLLRILPIINSEDVFALKGGTAINFFFRDLPRLSVDIDLAYLPLKDRDTSLEEINDRLLNIEKNIYRTLPEVKINRKQLTGNRSVYGLLINNRDAIVKIESNTTIRGMVYPAVEIKLCKQAEEIFELSLSTRILSLEDIYGGKICATLDRQHPRDLFDVKLLLENEGLTDGIRKAFIVYLISHDRPIVELLNPGLKDIKDTLQNNFAGMTSDPVEFNELIETRTKLIELIKVSLTENEIKFLLSFKNKNPDWNLLGLDGIEKLPAVQWKLINLNKLKPDKHILAYKKLEAYLLKP